MKTFSISKAILFALLTISTIGQAAVITFDNARGTSLDYDESGFGFHVAPHLIPGDVMVPIGNYHYSNVPYNGTGFMTWDRTYPQLAHIVITPTDGSEFGLLSVDLADKNVPTSQSVSIIFNGFKSDNSMVTTTFSRPSSPDIYFQPFTFGPDFVSGLVRVEIHSDRFAMDNLVIVPEPSTITFFIVGLGAYTGWFWKKRRV